MRFRPILVCILLACAPQAFAWGALGHRVVARLAEQQLTPPAWAVAKRLLAVRDAKHLEDIANWPDQLRQTDPDLFKQTERLHYINFHSGDCIYVPSRDCRAGECVVAAIDTYARILGDRSRSDAARAEALAFVVHFVGDVHQPLHASPRDDRGANDVAVRWNGHTTNLHRVWDTLMLNSTELSPAQYTAKLAGERGRIASGGTPAEWAEESCRIVRDDGIYPASPDIDAAYVARERPIAERRLREAGVRLAQLLNRELARG